MGIFMSEAFKVWLDIWYFFYKKIFIGLVYYRDVYFKLRIKKLNIEVKL